MRKLLCTMLVPVFLFTVVFTAAARTPTPRSKGNSSPRCREKYRHRKGIGKSCRLTNGLLRVKLEDGRTIMTHGGDARSTNGTTTSTYAATSTRSPRCAPSGAPRMVVLYAYLSGRRNRVDYFRGTIRTIIRKNNYVLNQESRESGGPTADLKVMCNRYGSIAVRSLRVTGNTFQAVMSAASGAGYKRSGEKYNIFIDYSNLPYSGVATFCSDDRRAWDNCSNFGPSYAMTTYGYWRTTSLHETAHTMGGVQQSAPDSSGATHCDGHPHSSANNPYAGDALCYQDGGYRWDGYDACREEEARLHFDRCHNDYFDSREEPGEYLATHWNIGWRGNRFIAFGR